MIQKSETQENNQTKELKPARSNRTGALVAKSSVSLKGHHKRFNTFVLTMDESEREKGKKLNGDK